MKSSTHTPTLKRQNKKAEYILLFLILSLAGILRFYRLDEVPPGLNQDEACNAWNAYCLLKLGTDQWGDHFPVFYSRAMGDYRSTLFLYYMIPFLAPFGLNAAAIRCPNAIGGVLTVLLIYLIARSLFGRRGGLLAALFLAFNPWHLLHSRTGFEAGMIPLLSALVVFLLLYAGWPIADDKTRSTPKIIPTALAAGIAGIGCYGYPAMRLFMPLFCAVLLLMHAPYILRGLRSGGYTFPLVVCLVTFFAAFFPLVYVHLTNPLINTRAQGEWIWSPEDDLSTAVANVVDRYFCHFDVNDLFHHGTPDVIHSIPGWGLFQWFMLPLMLWGAVIAVRRFTDSASARTLIAWIVCYPLGDCLNYAQGIHPLRIMPGVVPLILLAAYGAVHIPLLSHERHRWIGRALTASLAILAIFQVQNYIRAFFCAWPTLPTVYGQYHADLVKALEWLEPRRDEFDAVFFTSRGFRMPCYIALCTWNYDPHRWMEVEKQFWKRGYWEPCIRFDKYYFLEGPQADRLRREMTINRNNRRIWFVVRPGEYQYLGPPEATIEGPNDEPRLVIHMETY